MSALQAESAAFSRKNALRKTPGKPVIRKNRPFSARQQLVLASAYFERIVEHQLQWYYDKAQRRI